MNMPSRRKMGAAALIVAGLAAVLVPFMLHSISPQGSSPSPTTPGGNNNNGNNGGKTPTSPGGSGGSGGNTCTSNCSSSDTSGGNSKTGSCSEAKSSDTDRDPQAKGNGRHNGNAYGVLKNKLDTTVALVKAMGTHDPAYHLHHDTDTDNETAHGPHNVHDPGDHDSSCASGEEKHE